MIGRLLAMTAIVMAFIASPIQAADRVTLQLRWVIQTQFAGYFVAKGKGFYREAGLDVRINPGGPDAPVPQIMAGRGADVGIDWMPRALAARENGVPLVNIAQPFKHSGLEITCLHSKGVRTPKDLLGKTVGLSFAGDQYPFFAWMKDLHIPTNGGPDGVALLKSGFNVVPLVRGPADCVSTMTYNEYWQLIDAGYRPDQLAVFKFEDEGVATLEDGLYVLGPRLSDDAFVDRMARFVKQSMRGWAYAAAHPKETVRIVLEADTTGALTEEVQSRMLRGILKLVDGGDGVLNPVAYERTVQVLLEGGALTQDPQGAWTHAVTDRAGLSP